MNHHIKINGVIYSIADITEISETYALWSDTIRSAMHNNYTTYIGKKVKVALPNLKKTNMAHEFEVDVKDGLWISKRYGFFFTVTFKNGDMISSFIYDKQYGADKYRNELVKIHTQYMNSIPIINI